MPVHASALAGALQTAGFAPRLQDDDAPAALRAELPDGVYALAVASPGACSCRLFDATDTPATLADGTPLVLEAIGDWLCDDDGNEYEAIQFGYDHDGTFITDPMVSDCGRFDADPLADHGIAPQWARALVDMNTRMATARTEACA